MNNIMNRIALAIIGGVTILWVIYSQNYYNNPPYNSCNNSPTVSVPVRCLP